MAYRVRPCRSLDELGQAAGAIGHYFGWVPTEEEVERFSQAPAARADARGLRRQGDRRRSGSVPVRDDRSGRAGAVRRRHGRRRAADAPAPRAPLPDDARADRRHPRARRAVRGALGLRADDLRPLRLRPRLAHARDPLAAGLGGAARGNACARRPGAPRRAGRGAAKIFPRLYQKVARETPGFLSRSKAWWELRRLRDDPSRRPPGSGPLNRALLEIDGRAAGYALYRIVQSEEDGHWKRNLRVVEALGVDAVATREIWRFLLEVDWTDEIQAWLLPTDHPVQHLVARFDRLDLRVGTGLWVRPVDVGASPLRAELPRLTAASRSSFGTRSARGTRARGRSPTESRSGRAAGRIFDSTCRRSARRTSAAISFAELSRAGLVEETSRGGLARADALFASDRAPWCPEIF